MSEGQAIIETTAEKLRYEELLFWERAYFNTLGVYNSASSAKETADAALAARRAVFPTGGR